jgi:hypothetical protein
MSPFEVLEFLRSYCVNRVVTVGAGCPGCQMCSCGKGCMKPSSWTNSQMEAAAKLVEAHCAWPATEQR